MQNICVRVVSVAGILRFASCNAMFVSIFTSICDDMGSFHVIHDYCNAVVVSTFTSICNDMGSFHVIQDYWNAAFVSIFIAHVTIWEHFM